MVKTPLGPFDVAGKRILVTGSSRGIGAQVAKFVAEAGASVAINYRSKAPRAEKVASEIRESGGRAITVGADVTDPVAVRAMLATISEEWGGLDVLVLNASGGMEADMAENYAMTLNRDAQVGLVIAAKSLMGQGGRIVFVTSHQAHFIHDVPTLPEYTPVALSKRAGEDALRAMADELSLSGIELVVVSGDMIEGTVTATLLNRMRPGALDERKEAAGKLYNVEEFAAEVTKAIVEPIPQNRTRYVGDVSWFLDQRA